MNLSRLLRPRTIAVFGGKPAAEVIRQNDRLGFNGEIWPAHPDKSEIEGRRVYADANTLPGAPDAVFLAVNRHASVEIVAALARRGAGGVVCYASGFAETNDDGATLQRRLVAAAGDMPLLGPNCYGLLNYQDGVALWPDQHGGERVAGGVAIVTQSGNIGCNLTMQSRGLPIAFLAALGNQAMIGLSDIIGALAQQPGITAIGLHVEAIDDATAFANAVAIATRCGVPVVALKTGASAAGAALTISHTASLAGADDVASVYFRRIGVGRVASVPELLEALKLLHVHGRLTGADIAAISSSGGEAALMADRAARTDVSLPRFTPERHAAIAATVPSLVTVSNPFDFHTFHWAKREPLAQTFAAVMRAGCSLNVFILDFPRTPRCDDTDWATSVLALSDAQAATGRPAAVLATLPECMPEARAKELIRIGIVPLCGVDEALTAIAVATRCGVAGDHLAATPPLIDGTPVTLDEWASKQLLARHGVPVPRGARVTETAAARATTFPVVAKAIGIAHKTEQDAVRLRLGTPAALADAVGSLMKLGDAVLVEEMVDGVAELIVGVVRDPVVGLVLLLGSGGVLAELVADRVVLMLPAGPTDIRAALSTLRVAALIAGHRGRPAGSLEAAIAAILAIQAFALDHADRLIELDVNPLIVTPDSAVAADALIRLVEPT